MATPASRFNGVQLTVSVGSPVTAGAGGLWWDGNTTGPLWRKADGTDVTLGAGGGGGSSTLKTAYTTGASQTDSTMTLDSTRLGIQILDAASSVGTLLNIANNGNTTSYLSISGNGGHSIKSAAASGGNALTLDTTTAWTGGNLLRILSGGTNRYLFQPFGLTISPVAVAGAPTALTLTAAANPTNTASTEVPDINLNLARTTTWAAGALTTQRFMRVQPPTIAFASASTVTNAYTAAFEGAPKAGTNATLTSTSAVGIFTGADAAHGLTLVPNSSSQTGAMWRSLDASGNTLASLVMTDGGQSNQLQLTSQLNGGYTFLHGSCATTTLDMQLNSGLLLMAVSGADYRFYSSSFSTQLANIQASGVHSQRFAPISSQTVAFSATPAFDPTAGNFIDFGPVTGNVTGPTMVAGQAGEQCTIVMRKDATASAYTVATSWGSNVRMDSTALAFTTGSGSLIALRFVWDDRLSTPAWVETSRKAFN